MNDLLDAVDALTLPEEVRVTQDILKTKMQPSGRPVIDEQGNPIREVKGQQTMTVTHPPLLRRLEDAIASTIGAGGGRVMTAAWELSVLDSGALHQFAMIESQIRDWCRMVGVRAHRHPVDNLRAWYAATLSKNLTDEQAAVYRDQLRKWAALIRGKLNPPQTMQLTEPCPSCKAATWKDDDGVEYPHPITITYRAGDPDILATARAECRACDKEWRGQSELRALRWDVDHTEDSDESLSLALTTEREPS